MEEKNVNLTYETLFELLRREKARGELQKLDKNFFEDVTNYLNEKKIALQEQKSKVDIFSSTEKEKTQKQIENIKKILKELYEKRESKILSLALSKSKIPDILIDESVFVEEETKFFEQLTILINIYRNSVLMRILKGKLPFFEEKQEIKSEDIPETREKEQTTEKKEPENTNKIIRFKNAVPAFLGADLEEYGPFDADEIANLPKELASLLVEKERAEFIEEK